MNREIHRRALAQVGACPDSVGGEGLHVQPLEWLGDEPSPSLADGAPGHGTWWVVLAPGTTWHWSPGPSTDLYVVSGALREGDRHHPAGTFVRRHREVTWTSEEGAELWVKQLPPLPTAPSPVTVRRRREAFAPSHTRGLWLQELVNDGPRRTVLLHFEAGTAIGPHRHERGEELLVLEGRLVDDHGAYPPRTWLRQPPASSHRVHAPEACTLLTVSGHL